jgi:hypothetical protein
VQFDGPGEGRSAGEGEISLSQGVRIDGEATVIIEQQIVEEGHASASCFAFNAWDSAGQAASASVCLDEFSPEDRLAELDAAASTDGGAAAPDASSDSTETPNAAPDEGANDPSARDPIADGPATGDAETDDSAAAAPGDAADDDMTDDDSTNVANEASVGGEPTVAATGVDTSSEGSSGGCSVVNPDPESRVPRSSWLVLGLALSWGRRRTSARR